MLSANINNMMNILCATDDSYAPYCGIMLTSLFESHPHNKLNVYVLTAQLNEQHQKEYTLLASRYGQCINIVNVDPHDFQDCPFNPETDHVSEAAYYRLMVGKLLPKELDRILYLDCDIIVNKSLCNLYTTDLTGKACGVIIDEAEYMDKHYNRIGLDKKLYHYFNSGVLLINLDYWRNHDIDNRCMSYIARNKERLAFHDQDTLNMVVKDEVSFLPLTYNFQSAFLFKAILPSFSKAMQSEITDTAPNAKIIHFTGPSKPWFKGSRHPYVKTWLRYRDLSLWSKYPLKSVKKSSKERIRERVVELIWRLHLKPRPQTYIIPMQDE